VAVRSREVFDGKTVGGLGWQVGSDVSSIVTLSRHQWGWLVLSSSLLWKREVVGVGGRHVGNT